MVNRKSIGVRDLEVFIRHEECVTAIYGKDLPLHKFVSNLSSSDWKYFKNKIPDFTEVMNMSMYLSAVKPGIQN